MFEYKGDQYELKFNLERIRLVENYLKLPTVADIVSTNGALSISSIETYFRFCLKKAGEDNFVPPKEAAVIADQMIEEMGYIQVNNMVIEKMAEDMPFLFRSA